MAVLVPSAGRVAFKLFLLRVQRPALVLSALLAS